MYGFLCSVSRAIALVAAGIAVAGPGILQAQSSFDGSLTHLKPYSASFDYFVEGDDGAPIKAGRWTDRVTIRDGALSREVLRYTNDGQVDLLRTVIVERDSVRPIRIQQRFGPDLINVYQAEFSGLSMTQILIGDAAVPARVSTAELEGPVVEMGLNAVFALSLPMNASSEVTVDGYVAGAKPTVIEKTFHVVGQEDVSAMGQSFTAWRIEDRAAQWTYWVRREVPYIVQVVHPLPGGVMSTSVLTEFGSIEN